LFTRRIRRRCEEKGEFFLVRWTWGGVNMCTKMICDMDIDERIRIYRLLTQPVKGIVVYYLPKGTATVTIETLVMLHVRGGRTTTCTLCIKIDTIF
jgi:hypothetical protein